MLSFNLRVGDDVYLGKQGAPLDAFQPLILKETNGRHLTILTPEEVIDIPFDGQKVDVGMFGVLVCARQDASDKDMFTLGLEAPRSVRILRGRVYRRELD